jgi:opacity protein-like surface antigen
MRKSILCFIGSLIMLPSLLHAQATAAAIRRGAIQVGVAGSSYTLDYGEGREEGITVYGDVDISRHLGAEVAYTNASIITPHDIGENNIMAGPRLHFEKGRFSPYVKAVMGRATINFQQGYNATSSSQSYFAYGLGGGVDFHLKRHINIRLIDYEYQRWPNFAPHGLTPTGLSAGVAYVF